MTEKELEDWGNICSYGNVGELYPVTWALRGSVSPLPAAAWSARRAIELFSGPDGGSGGRIPLFTMDEDSKSGNSLDKLQRITPDPTGCFLLNDIDIHNEKFFKGPNLSVPNKAKEGTESIRYIYWNKKRVCTCPYMGPQAFTKDITPKSKPYNERLWGYLRAG